MNLLKGVSFSDFKTFVLCTMFRNLSHANEHYLKFVFCSVFRFLALFSDCICACLGESVFTLTFMRLVGRN